MLVNEHLLTVNVSSDQLLTVLMLIYIVTINIVNRLMILIVFPKVHCVECRKCVIAFDQNLNL